MSVLCEMFLTNIYFQTIPQAMAYLRNIHAICPPEVFEFIMCLFKYNDNSRNKVRYQKDNSLKRVNKNMIRTAKESNKYFLIKP